MTREEHIEQLKKLRSFHNGSYGRSINKAIEALNQQKEGYWKRIGYDIYECSICGQNVQTGDICAYKHCHGCGARMESDTEQGLSYADQDTLMSAT